MKRRKRRAPASLQLGAVSRCASSQRGTGPALPRKSTPRTTGTGFPFAALRAFAVVILASTVGFCAIAENAPASSAVTRAGKLFEAARARHQSAPTNSEAAWKFGQACFDWADLSPNNRQREQIANEGIAACRQLVVREPKSVPGNYYLGMNLAQLARTKSLGALKIVREMESEFQLVLALDSHFDFAGADRNLGLLYRDCPGWPTSIGSRKKAAQNLQHAVELAPEYPENRLNLAESQVEWGEKKNAAEELKKIEAQLSEARRKFSGEQWESSWSDWDSRIQKLRIKLGQPAPSSGSPHGKK